LYWITLSDYPDKEHKRLRDERHARFAQAQAEYDQALALYIARRDARKQEKRDALVSLRWRNWLKLTLSGSPEEQRPLGPPTLPASSDREAILLAGSVAEEVMGCVYKDRMNDAWTLFSGYKNPQGEIDHILLGPTGLYAIEIKNHNATVYCEGTRWRYRKYDNYGNLKREYFEVDGRGRSPSQQLNAPATSLEGFLHRRRHKVHIHRIVIYTHERSNIAYRGDDTIDLVTESVHDAIDLMGAGPRLLEQRQAEEIEALIIRDHRFHESRQARARED
jgi:hypothetical protein